MSRGDNVWVVVWGLWMPVLLAFEGLRQRPYLCAASVPTIGIGSTYYADGRRVRLTDPPITAAAAWGLAERVAWETYQRVRAQVSGCSPAQLAALCDFHYNVGQGQFAASTLLRKVRAGQMSDVPAQFRRWTRSGGKVQRGLVRRAEARVRLFQAVE